MASCVPSAKSSEDSMHQCYDNYVIVDIGANLTNKKYSRDLDSVIQRAKDAGKHTAILIIYVLQFFSAAMYFFV